MKKLQDLHFLMLFAFLPIFFNSCTKDEEVKLDFDITMPSDWNYVTYANEGFIFAAGRTAVNAQDSILEGLYIYKESLPNYTLLTYYSTLKPIITDSPSYDELLEEKDTVINETNFKRMLSRETQKYINSFNDTFDLNAITTRYFFFEKNHGYNILLVSIDTSYNRNKPIFDGIMNSFQYKY